jgi:nucleoside-diphosphate-sugar epimerase
MRSNHPYPLNVGSDRLISINDMVDLVARIAGSEIVKKHIQGPQGVRGRNSDNTRLRQVLGWEPQVSLEEGLERTYSWVEDQVRQKVQSEGAGGEEPGASSQSRARS